MVLAGAPRPRLEPNLDQDNRPDRRQKPSGGYRCVQGLSCFAKNWMALDAAVRDPFADNCVRAPLGNCLEDMWAEKFDYFGWAIKSSIEP